MYLLDTHALLWFLSGDSQLPKRIKTLIENPQLPVHASVVNTWEIAIKESLGKIKVPKDLPRLILKANLDILNITTAHTWALRDLPDIHQDPFDRLLIAQAAVTKCTLITADSRIHEYPIKCLWE